MTSWLKDKAAVALATGNPIEKAVVKATNRDVVQPKVKHVRSIQLTTYDRSQADMVEAIRYLVRRLESSGDWIVVLKSLTVFHQVFREGHDAFIAKLSGHAALFGGLSQFLDRSSPAAFGQSAFIREYARYLEVKLTVYGRTKVQYEKPPSTRESLVRMSELSQTRLLRHLPLLQKQINVILTIEPGAEMNNQAIVFAYSLLLKDAFRLFLQINDGIISIVEAFFEMTHSRALEAIQLYQEYITESKRMQAMLKNAKQIPGLDFDFPKLKTAPTGLLEAMEEYVNEGNLDTTPVQDVNDLFKDSGDGPIDLIVNPDATPTPASTSPAPAPAPTPLINFGGPVTTTTAATTASPFPPAATTTATTASPFPPAATTTAATASPFPPATATGTATAGFPFSNVPFEQTMATGGSPAATATPGTGGSLLLPDKSYEDKSMEIQTIMSAFGSQPQPAAPRSGNGLVVNPFGPPQPFPGQGAPPASGASGASDPFGPPITAEATSLPPALVPEKSTPVKQTAKPVSNNPFDFL